MNNKPRLWPSIRENALHAVVFMPLQGLLLFLNPDGPVTVLAFIVVYSAYPWMLTVDYKLYRARLELWELRNGIIRMEF